MKHYYVTYHWIGEGQQGLGWVVAKMNAGIFDPRQLQKQLDDKHGSVIFLNWKEITKEESDLFKVVNNRRENP